MHLGFSAYRHFSLNGWSLALFGPFLNLLTNTHFIYVQMRQKNKASIKSQLHWKPNEKDSIGTRHMLRKILMFGHINTKGCFAIHNINILWQYPCSQHGKITSPHPHRSDYASTLGAFLLRLCYLVFFDKLILMRQVFRNMPILHMVIVFDEVFQAGNLPHGYVVEW
jgi:hypothetical protein